jgi:hypothetical protein
MTVQCSCNNLDADFGSRILDAGFCIIALLRLDSTSAACNGLVVISIPVVIIYGTEYTLPHSSHASNEQRGIVECGIIQRLSGNSVTGVTGVMRECSFIWIPPCITVHAV